MKISIIGAGRVGQTIGRLARQSGHQIGDVICRTKESAAVAVEFIGGGTPRQAATVRLATAELLLIATPDDSISKAAAIIKRSRKLSPPAAVLHTSGALSSEVLSGLADVGFSIGSCHPMHAFESAARSVPLIEGAYFCIEGHPYAVRLARRLVRDIGGRPFQIKTELKELYHAAAVIASTGPVALVSKSIEMLKECGLTEQRALRMLSPLVETTASNIGAVGPARALTGPVRRGDAGTVTRNVNALAAFDPAWVDVYILLAVEAMRLAERAGVSRVKLKHVRNYLRNASGC